MGVVRVAEAPTRGDIFLINLDPTVGREIKKTRPCVIVSPDELNAHLSTFLIAPLTTGKHACPFRIGCRFQKKDGYIVLDQIRTIDQRRLVKKLGRITPVTTTKVLDTLQEMFAE